MKKAIFILGLGLLCATAVLAQKRDTAVYYLKNTGKLVSTRDSADFVIQVTKSDTGGDKNLFIVKEFYRNGQLAIVGNSTTDQLRSLKFQGIQITYFLNGNKAIVKNFEDGQLVGDISQYYP